MEKKKSTSVEELDKSLKSLQILMYISAQNGETYFTLSQKGVPKLITRKCLYDALSDYGIGYDKAKDIVMDMVPQIKKTFTYKLCASDVGPKYDIE